MHAARVRATGQGVCTTRCISQPQAPVFSFATFTCAGVATCRVNLYRMCVGIVPEQRRIGHRSRQSCHCIASQCRQT
eukprot:m.733590 g.733590  ORF g.733590 m.733590 type:complete len:77 (-) comp23072_c0_seq10:2291-2521(-)